MLIPKPRDRQTDGPTPLVYDWTMSLPHVHHKYGSLFVISSHWSAQVEQCFLLCSVQVDEFGVVVFLLATLAEERGKLNNHKVFWSWFGICFYWNFSQTVNLTLTPSLRSDWLSLILFFAQLIPQEVRKCTELFTVSGSWRQVQLYIFRSFSRFFLSKVPDSNSYIHANQPIRSSLGV